MTQNAWYLSYSAVIGLCRLAYSDASPNASGYSYWLSGSRPWKITCIYNKKGFRAITVKGFDLLNNSIKVVAFAGSDMKLNDWLLEGNLGTGLKGSEHTMQCQAGLEVARKERPNYLVGHSLGGGIANYCSLEMHIRAATINPAPVIAGLFDVPLGDTRNYSWSINYCVDGEALAAIRKKYSNGVPGTRISVKSRADMASPIARHKLPYLLDYYDPQRAY